MVKVLNFFYVVEFVSKRKDGMGTFLEVDQPLFGSYYETVELL